MSSFFLFNLIMNTENKFVYFIVNLSQIVTNEFQIPICQLQINTDLQST